MGARVDTHQYICWRRVRDDVMRDQYTLGPRYFETLWVTTYCDQDIQIVWVTTNCLANVYWDRMDGIIMLSSSCSTAVRFSGTLLCQILGVILPNEFLIQRYSTCNYSIGVRAV